MKERCQKSKCRRLAVYMVRRLTGGAQYEFYCKTHGDKLPEDEYGWTGL